MLKKVFCILITVVIIISSFSSCGTPTTSTDETKSQQTQSGTPSDTGEMSDEETRDSLDIPDTRYENQNLTFLTRGDEGEWTTMEIFSSSLTSTSDNISNAVYERNLRILENYGVTVREIKKNKNEHLTSVTNEIAGNNGDFQVIVTNTPNSASLSSQGALWNLNSDSIEYLDLSKSWWDQNMVKGMSMHDRLYFVTGDLLTSDNDATYVLLFNKKIAADNQLPNFYDLVENGEWTMSAFYEYATQAVQEKDGQDGLSYDGDVAGYAYNSSSPNSFLLAGGITLCQKDENDLPFYNLDVERMQNIADLGKRIFDKSHAIYMDDLTSEGASLAEIGQVCFGENHALFLGEVMQAVTRMRSYDVDFGILPFPMYDSEQGDYFSMMHQTASMVSIPKNVVGETLDMTTAMLEALAYHSVDTLTVQYYDINLKTKGAKDVESGPMIDRILANRSYDLCYYYNWGSNTFGKMAGTLLPTSSDSVSSLNRKLGRSVNTDIQNMIEAMDDMADKYD